MFESPRTHIRIKCSECCGSGDVPRCSMNQEMFEFPCERCKGIGGWYIDRRDLYNTDHVPNKELYENEEYKKLLIEKLKNQ